MKSTKSKINFLAFTLAFVISLSLTSCESDPKDIADIQIITYEVDDADVKSSSAFLTGRVLFGQAENFEYMHSGFVYSSIDEFPVVYDDGEPFANYYEGNIICPTDYKGNIECYISCYPLTTYFYRAYICYRWGNTIRYDYGETCYFKTPNFPTTVYPVDLGLSVMWADANLGAEDIEDVGQYFAWGELSPKRDYTWGNYEFGTERTLAKYNNDPRKGVVDNEYLLRPEDDAATYYLGDGWAIPTAAEWQELFDNCEWEWTTSLGVYGYRFYGRGVYHNSTIFIPATNYCRNGILGPFINDESSTCMYWSSTNASNEGLPEMAYSCYLCSYDLSYPFMMVTEDDRAYGLAIRPVLIK